MTVLQFIIASVVILAFLVGLAFLIKSIFSRRLKALQEEIDALEDEKLDLQMDNMVRPVEKTG